MTAFNHLHKIDKTTKAADEILFAPTPTLRVSAAQHMSRCGENGHGAAQYGENGHGAAQYGENGRGAAQYGENGRTVIEIRAHGVL